MPFGSLTDVQPIIHRGRLVAVATSTEFVLVDRLARAQPHDPERMFVVFMCVYAGDVANGVLPGPYNDVAARCYASAASMGIPVEELRAARPARTAFACEARRPRIGRPMTARAARRAGAVT
jgi:hypothetical protein